MALSTKQVTFNIGTGAATTTVDVTHADITSAPKAVIFMWGGSTSSTDAVGSDDIQAGAGFAVSSSSRRAVTFQADDNSGNNEASYSHRDDSCIACLTTGAALDGAADFDSFLSNGCRLVIDDQFATDLRVTAWFIFGTDVTDAGIITITEPSDTSAHDYTGFGCNPSIVFGISPSGGTAPTAANINTIVSGQTGLRIGAANAGGQWTIGTACANGVGAAHYGLAGEFLAFEGTGNISARCQFNSFVSDGVNLTFVERNSTTRIYFLLGIEGGTWTVGDSTTQTDTVTAISVATSGVVKGGLIASCCSAENTADQTAIVEGEMSVGAFDSASSRSAHAWMYQSGANPTETSVAVEHDACYANISTSDAIEGLMDVSAIGGASGVDFIMDDADPSAFFFGYVLAVQASAVTVPLLADAQQLFGGFRSMQGGLS